jgi:nicotinamide mononucleotide transporter
LELLTAVLTLLSAYFTVKENPICWPLSIISTIIYIYLLFFDKLYGQVIANIIMVIQCIYGWFYWNVINDKPPIVIKTNVLIRDIIIMFLVGILFVFLFKNYSNNSQPELDIISSIIALYANWYLAKKYITGFILWIIVDLLLISMFLHNGMFWFVIMYVILIGFAIHGYFKWLNHAKRI